MIGIGSCQLLRSLTGRSSVVKGMGYSPFFLNHGREAVLPGQMIAEDGRRLPVDETSAFVDELRNRLQSAFEQVVRNDTEGQLG